MAEDIDRINQRLFGKTRPDYLQQTLVGAFEENCRQHPTKIAIRFEQETLTYAELNAKANQLARYFQQQNLHPGDIVGLCYERNLELICLLLACIKSGVAYIPIDPHLPTQRIGNILEDAQPKAILVSPNTHSIFASFKLPLLSVDRSIPHFPKTDLGLQHPGNTLCYVIFTSGSTGRPKGVMIEHAAMNNLVLSLRDHPKFTAEDTMLALTTISFDIAVYELFVPLVSGGSIVLASAKHLRDPNALKSLLQQYPVTIMQATPTTYKMLLEVGWTAPKSIRLIVGGEALTAELASKLQQSGASVWNHYGPTEATVWITSDCVQEPKNGISLGQCFPNNKLYILDPEFNRVPLGETGELFLAGVQLARGYINREDLTRDRFIERILDGKTTRLYRTGDRVRLTESGRLEYIDRMDNQVKIRGFRIELGEIEAKLCALQEINHAAVIVKKFENDDLRIVAFYVGNTTCDDKYLQDALLKNLPEYMIPAFFVAIEAMPQTASAKIDRKVLETYPVVKGRSKISHPPSTLFEKAFAAIWSKALKVDLISLSDNFFDLGGHSLVLQEVVVSLQQQYDVTLEVEDFINLTLGQLCNKLDPTSASPQPSTPGLSINGLYLRSETSPLFATTHRSSSTSQKSCGIIICNSLGHEYIDSHRALRKLATELQSLDYPVIRFDYSGEGDSAGDFIDSHLQQWITDINSVVKYAYETLKVKEICFVGLRLGALFVLEFLKKQNISASAVLWEPILSGKEFTNIIRDRGEKIILDKRAAVQHLGFFYSEDLISELDKIDFSTSAEIRSNNNFYLQTPDENMAFEKTFSIESAAVPFAKIQNIIQWITQHEHH